MNKKAFIKNLILILLIMSFSIPSLFAVNTPEEELKLTRKLLYETSRVLVSQNNRTVLDEIYSFDWYPDISLTNSHYIADFRNDISEFKSIDVKRERLEYIYNQKKSMEIASLVPNALSVATVAFSSGDPKRAIISIAGTVLSSINSYLTTKQKNELEMIQEQWNLDDEASKVFNNLTNSIFINLTALSHNYGFSRFDFASPETIKDFVRIAEDENTTAKDIIMRFVGNRTEEELSKFSDYWRIIATAYYELEDYKSALSSIKKYEECFEDVFYHDENYAQMMMIKAYCIDELSIDKTEIVDELVKIADAIYNNFLEGEGWVQKYYCYQLYMDIADYTGDKSYLVKAFALLNEVFYTNIMTYADNLEDYLSFQFHEDIVNGIQQKIDEINEEIANLQERRKIAKSGETKKIIEEKVRNLNTVMDNYNKNKYKIKEISKKTLPPSISLLISLGYQYKNLAAELGLEDSLKYSATMDLLNSAVQDDYTKAIFFGKTNTTEDVNVNYKYNYLVFGMGDPVDIMKFRMPISTFTIISDDWSDMSIEICNIKKDIDIHISYSEDKKSTGWDYQIVREPVNGEINMNNTFVEFTVRFKEPLVTLKKGSDVPSLFLKFNGVNSQLDRMFGMNILNPKDFHDGFFKYE